MTELLKLKYFYIIFFLFITLLVLSSNKIFAEQKIKIIADEIQVDRTNGTIKAAGNAIAIDENGSKIKSEFILYNEAEGLINAEGKIILNDVEGNTYFFEKLETDDKILNFNGTKIKARLDDGSRIVGSSIVKRNNVSGLDNAEYTPCLENDYLIENCPGWKLKAKKIY